MYLITKFDIKMYNLFALGFDNKNLLYIYTRQLTNNAIIYKAQNDYIFKTAPMRREYKNLKIRTRNKMNFTNK